MDGLFISIEENLKEYTKVDFYGERVVGKVYPHHFDIIFCFNDEDDYVVVWRGRKQYFHTCMAH